MFIPWAFIVRSFFVRVPQTINTNLVQEFINVCIWLPCYLVSFILSIVFMAAGIKFCGNFPLCPRNTKSVNVVTMVVQCVS